jgi:hypothetical protein
MIRISRKFAIRSTDSSEKRDWMYFFCTYFDRNYLEKGLALYRSLTRHCQPFLLWILCMDDATFQMLAELRLPYIRLIALSEFEKGDIALHKAKQNRSLIEYYFTCTPTLPLYIINHNPEVDLITYLDADLFFFSSIDPVFSELGNQSVLIIGHRFPNFLKNREIYGIYNVGLLSFRRDQNGLECLNWWRDRCLEWCYDRVETNRFADQKYLDDWPVRFAGVVSLQHKGAGLAPWNIANYKYSSKSSVFSVDEQPLIVYHFHGLRRLNRWIYDANILDYRVKLPGILKTNPYRTYVKDLQDIYFDILKCSGKDEFRSPSIRGRAQDENPGHEKFFLIRIFETILTFLKKWANNDLILIVR